MTLKLFEYLRGTLMRRMTIISLTGCQGAKTGQNEIDAKKFTVHKCKTLREREYHLF